MYRIKTIKFCHKVVSLFIVFYPLAISAGIVGSAHDFSSSGWTGGEICIACHTPHNSNTNVTDAPLWNHQQSSASYTTYSSPTMDVQAQQPRGPTKLCLSCHDGTVALDSFGGKSGTTNISERANLGINLSDDHPVSIEWRHQDLITSGTFCTNCHFGPPREVVFFRPGGSGPIWIECATCHDVHNSTNHSYLLRKSMDGSELCLTCHEK